MFKKVSGIGIAVAILLTALFPTPAHAQGCTPERQLASGNIRQLHAEVKNANTGEVLFSYNADEPQRSASVLKTLTAAVALDVLGPDYQVTTNVYSDPLDPGSIYLVGAGDPTLSRMPAKITSYYAKGPKLDTLTRQIANWSRANGVPITSVQIDNSLFGGNDEWHETWSRRGLSQGYMAPVSALQIDAGRITSSRNKNQWLARRTATPVTQAGELFVASLNKRKLATGLVATEAVLPEGAVVIASVQSRPMREWIGNLLRVSDNTLSENIARLASLEAGFDGSMASLTPLFQQVLSKRGLDVSGLEIVDASGLSRDNRVPAALVNDLLLLVHQGVGEYSVIKSGFPVSGNPGSLRTRLANKNHAPARGLVAAKTGFITTGYSLSGFLTARDKTELIFTVYNLNDRVKLSQRRAMDNLIYRFFQCGAKLSN
jgi:D-alanyl-D-alanine carboxypeptidase/D-alanyl-D-alanine-endopeptidase (penicillin-binding protein 4)